MMLMLIQIFMQATGGTGGGTDVLQYLTPLNLGVLGLSVIAFVKGWVVPGFIFEREQKARIIAEEKLGEYQDRMTKEILPQLWETNRILSIVSGILDEDDPKGRSR